MSSPKLPTIFSLVLLIGVMVGCSGSAQRTIVQPVVTASITPTTVTLGSGGTQSFTAAVQNSSDTSVTWYVNQVNGGSSATGTISSSGAYTAPVVSSQTVFTVIAVANANTSSTASASVTVTPLISVTLNVHSASVQTGQTQQFAATVTNTTNVAVMWEVNGIVGGNSTVGTISASGLYTAPISVPPQNPVTITAISVADPTKSDSASVTITLTVVINVSVNPPTASVIVGNTQAFGATVTGTSNQAVTWSISGAACSGGGSPCGSIDSSGVYTAPGTLPSPPAVTVTATSQADGTTTGTATVTVIASLGVTVSPAGPLHVALSGTQVFMATVTGDPLNQGVTWTLTCSADDEGNPFEDCTGDNDMDGDENTLTTFGPSLNTTLMAAAVLAPPATSYVLTLTATTVATDSHGNHQSSLPITITIP